MKRKRISNQNNKEFQRIREEWFQKNVYNQQKCKYTDCRTKGVHEFKHGCNQEILRLCKPHHTNAIEHYEYNTNQTIQQWAKPDRECFYDTNTQSIIVERKQTKKSCTKCKKKLTLPNWADNILQTTEETKLWCTRCYYTYNHTQFRIITPFKQPWHQRTTTTFIFWILTKWGLPRDIARLIAHEEFLWDMQWEKRTLRGTLTYDSYLYLDEDRTNYNKRKTEQNQKSENKRAKIHNT